MNILDIIISVLLFFGVWKGFKRGLVFELAMLIGLIIGIYAGLKFSDLCFKFLQNYVHDEGYLLHILSFIIVFVAILFTFFVFAKIIESILKVTALNIFNKIAGGVFGLLKYSLVLSVIFLLLQPLERKLNLIPDHVKKESLIYPQILHASSWIYPALDEVTDEFRDRLGH